MIISIATKMKTL